MSTTDPLLAYRARFPIVDRTTYMISNSLGAMPDTAPEALRAYTDTWRRRGVRAWEEGWWDVCRAVGDLVAPIVGAPQGTIVMQPNVTLASAIVRSCFDWSGPRNRIVRTDLEFPSVMYLYEGARLEGAEIASVPPADDGMTVDLDRLLSAIDERTALVAVSHVLFKSAAIQDADAICARAREVGARVCLDLYQSAGAVPVALERWQVDFAVGGCLKWLCGGPGNAFLYVRRDLHIRLEPQITGWMAATEPFAFAPELERSPTISRFLTGTPDVPAHLVARPGLEIIASIGVDAIREKSKRLTDRIVARADEHGLEVRSPRHAEDRGGTITLEPPEPEAITRLLLDEEILVDYRPDAGIRLSPHFYNRDDECDRVVDRIAVLASTRVGAMS